MMVLSWRRVFLARARKEKIGGEGAQSFGPFITSQRCSLASSLLLLSRTKFQSHGNEREESERERERERKKEREKGAEGP